MASVPRDPWIDLKLKTPARIAIGRSGSSLPTREVLAFSMAHARARDAVHAQFDRDRLACDLAELGLKTVSVDSQATDRAVYLRRPDLGRCLDAAARGKLRSFAAARTPPLTIVIADGLSATAANAHALDLIKALQAHDAELEMGDGPIVLAKGARVALGDEIGALIGAQMVAVVIGERPGLSTFDSLSIYLTYAPAAGRSDAERNCISNIGHGRLVPMAAARNLAWLVTAARQRKLTGVALKDESSDSPALTHEEE